MSDDETNAFDSLTSAAYGGPGWSSRTATSREEIGTLWTRCGVESESAPLRSVLLHSPGEELRSIGDPDDVQMLAPIDPEVACLQHEAMTQAYRDAGVGVQFVDPAATPPPNLMFVADLVFMTPEGAILGRPASTVRAGEERHVARRLAELGIPILRSVRGRGTFEGADAAWIDRRTVILSTGLRTNAEGAAQVISTLQELGVDVVVAGLPHGAMHLMGVLRFADHDLAIAWPGRVPWAAVDALKAHGYRILFLPLEVSPGMALNFVTLGPKSILMPAGNPITQAFYEQAGIGVSTVDISELIKAAGGIACMSGVLERG
jgi:N-dimethylarginine dimethylaminohydrolase